MTTDTNNLIPRPTTAGVNERYLTLFAKVVDLGRAFSTATGEDWQIVEPEVKEHYNGVTLAGANDKRLTVAYNQHSYYEKRLRITCRMPGGDWTNMRLTATYAWARNVDEIARDFVRKFMAPYAQELLASKRRVEVREEVNDKNIESAQQLAKLMKTEMPPPKDRRYGHLSLHLCACSPESVSGAVTIDTPMKSISRTEYGPQTVEIKVGNLRVDDAKEILRLVMKIHNRRERNLKRRKAKP